MPVVARDRGAVLFVADVERERRRGCRRRRDALAAVPVAVASCTSVT